MRYFVLAAFFLLSSAFSQTVGQSDKQNKLRELEKFYSDIYSDSLNTGKEFAYEAFELSNSIQDTISLIEAALYIGKAEAVEFNFDTSSSYLNNALLLSKHFEDTSLIAESFTQFGRHYYLKPDYEQALEYLHQSEELLDDAINNYETVILTYFYLSLTYNKLGEIETSLKYAGTVIEEMQEPSSYLARIYAHISIIYRDAGDIRRSVDYLMKSIELSEKLGDWNNVSRNYVLLAGLTKNSGRLKDAEKYYKKAIKFAEKNNDLRGVGYAYMNSGSIPFNQGNFEKAREYYKKALPYFEKTNDLHYLAFTNNNIGETFLNTGKVDSAEVYITKALKYGLQSSNRISIGLSQHSLGKIAMINDNYEKAINHFQKSLEDDYIETVVQNYSQLSESYNALGKPDFALYYLKLRDEVKDSMFNMSAQRLVIDAEIKYDVDQKVKELEAARMEKEDIEDKFNTSKNLTFFLVISGFVLIGTVIFYYRNKTIAFIQKLSPLSKEGNGDKRKLKSLKKAIDEAAYVQTEKKALSDDIVNEITGKLEKVMIEEKIFLNPQINQTSVAKKIETNTTYLSRAINQKYDLNFSSYINAYRVEEAKKIISGEERGMFSYEGIAHSVGFTSKSAFYSAFKRFTGKTPSQFSEEARKS